MLIQVALIQWSECRTNSKFRCIVGFIVYRVEFIVHRMSSSLNTPAGQGLVAGDETRNSIEARCCPLTKKFAGAAGHVLIRRRLQSPDR